MSGHSHAKTVLHRKKSADEKRGKIFSKLARMISIAAREGKDPETNPALRRTLDEAKKFNMPKDKIERAVKRGTGELGGEELNEVSFEAFGPGGAALIIEGITDNRNRTLGEIKKTLQRHNGKLADEGSVKWLFERKGIIIVNPKFQTPNPKDKENLELKIIEAGAEDIYWREVEGEEILEITTKPEELDNIRKKLETAGVEVESAVLGWLSREEIEVPENESLACQKLFEELEGLDAVQEIYSNLKI